ncbi:MAG: SDR family oxidoreductase [Bacteroidetes bacterium]|nr:SDR family oxidoreductase [Bacteroidota bacterium]
MKILFIGGTGNISTSVSRLAVEQGFELFLLNRGKSGIEIPGAAVLIGDINDEKRTADLLKGHVWDTVVNWIAFTPEEVERDIRLFAGKTRQYIFISSASCYQKQNGSPIITESTPLNNPIWDYSMQKIHCEELLLAAYKKSGFPATIVRPSHTYDLLLPVPFGGSRDSTILDRIRKGKRILVHGDGTSLWVLTHSRDFAKGFTGLMGNPAAVSHAFHITSDEVLTWNGIVQTIAWALGTEANLVHVSSEMICRHFPESRGTLLGDKAHSSIFDNTKIKRFVPTYSADIPFKTGILETIEKFNTFPGFQNVNEEMNKTIDDFLDISERF